MSPCHCSYPPLAHGACVLDNLSPAPFSVLTTVLWTSSTSSAFSCYCGFLRAASGPYWKEVG